VVFSSHIFAFYFLPLALLPHDAVPRRGQHIQHAELPTDWAEEAVSVLQGKDPQAQPAGGRRRSSARCSRIA
jgi:hypothetical protein